MTALLTQTATAPSTPGAPSRPRDRFIDFVRAFSILAVVVGHWLMDIIDWDDPAWTHSLLVSIQPMQYVTWVLHVIPLFFFVGGFANALSLRSAHRRGLPYAAFLRHRLERLLRPVAVFLAVWLPLAYLMRSGWPDSVVAENIMLGAFRPLWFIPVYILFVALTPWTLALHKRFGWAVPAALVVTVILLDAARLGFGMTGLGMVNNFVVFLLAYQVGYFYADGRLQRLRWPLLLAVALGALAMLAALTTVGPYSPSMLAVPDGRVPNADPASAAFATLSIWLIALTLLLRAPIDRLAAQPGVWAAVVKVNLYIMTIYVWHTSAWSLTIVTLHLLGVPLIEAGTPLWWLLLPLWLALLGLVLAGFVWVFGRFEQVPWPGGAHPTGPDARVDRPAEAFGRLPS